MQNSPNLPGGSSSHSAIELLAPAGDWDCARAAVENGADAIYFGLDVGFNARARATNFHLDDLPRFNANVASPSRARLCDAEHACLHR